MAEIKTIEEAKLKIGQQVKFAYNKNTMSKDLAGVDTLIGTARKLISTWEHTDKGDKCISFTFDKVDVVDPNNGGLHYISPEKAFSDDTKDTDIINVAAIDEIAKLQARIVELEANKTLEVEDKSDGK